MTARSLPAARRIHATPGRETDRGIADDERSGRLISRVTRLELVLASAVVVICLLGALAVGVTYSGRA